MIDAKELRIGNYIKYAGSGEIGRAIEITRYGNIAIDLDREEMKPSEYDPVPLTPEILEQCGFTKVTIDRYVSYEMNVGQFGKLVYYNGLLDFGIWGIGQCHFANLNLEFLHQLQNVVFAVTGVELEVNLK